MNERVDQALSDSDVWFPGCRGDIAHHLISLAGEVGEICNLYKKWDRDRTQIVMSDELLDRLREELVDVLVYAFNLAGELNADLEREYDNKRRINHGRFAPAGTPLRAGTDA